MVDDQRRLVQQYGEIIMGYLTGAVVQYEAFKQKTVESKSPIILSKGIETIVTKIESAFGDLNLEKGLLEQYDSPVVSWKELAYSVKEYALQNGIEARWDVFRTVMQDLTSLKVITQTGIEQRDIKNPLYALNMNLFTKHEIQDKCITLRESLDGRLKRFLDNNVATEILLALCAATPDIEGFDLDNLPEDYEHMRKYTEKVLKNYGRGTLIWKLKDKGIHYDSFMKTVDNLVNANLLKLIFSDKSESIIINPVLKPFSVITKIIEAYEGKKNGLVEVESSKKETTPLGNIVDLSTLGGQNRNMYFFPDDLEWDVPEHFEE